MSFLSKTIISLGVFFLPFAASAHEVYVLSSMQVKDALSKPAFDAYAVAMNDFGAFTFWAVIAVVTIGAVFLISISRQVERVIDPFLRRIRTYAPHIARVTVGIAFLLGAAYEASYGPELPLSMMFGQWATVASVLYAVIGMCFIFGTYVRFAAVVGIALFAIVVAQKGLYMLTYLSYLGELLVVFIMGAHHVSKHGAKLAHGWKRRLDKWQQRLTPYTFLILRVTFGISILYSSIYAKILHNSLALAVVEHYPDLQAFFGLEPHFLVMGAGIVEVLIGLFFIFGIEIRFTALFLEFWLALSLWYFGEAVWPHLVLIGIPIAFIFYGYDRYSLEGYFFKRGRREPVL